MNSIVGAAFCGRPIGVKYASDWVATEGHPYREFITPVNRLNHRQMRDLIDAVAEKLDTYLPK